MDYTSKIHNLKKLNRFKKKKKNTANAHQEKADKLSSPDPGEESVNPPRQRI